MGRNNCWGLFTARGSAEAQAEAGDRMHAQLLIVDYGWDWA